MTTRRVWARLELRSVAGMVLAAVLGVVVFLPASAQQRPANSAGPRNGASTAPESAQQAAPIDLTGYWVSVVTEDWRYRMVTPAIGDVASLPLNAEGLRVANAWDLSRDNASGNQCKAFGAAAIMREPGRFHITWQDPNTLRIDTDSGMQTRLLHFNSTKPPAGKPDWQGYSVANWVFAGPTPQEVALGGRPRRTPGAQQERQHRGGSLHVVTTHMRPGYLRKNGVPYSGDARLTEFMDRTSDFGEDWLIITTIVEDPTYLLQPFITSTHLKREPDGSKWDPTPCYTDPPLTKNKPAQLNQ